MTINVGGIDDDVIVDDAKIEIDPQDQVLLVDLPEFCSQLRNQCQSIHQVCM